MNKIQFPYGRSETLPDQWITQILIRILMRAKVIYVSDADDSIVEKMHMTPAHSLEDVLLLAKKHLGKEDIKTAAIPDGVSVIVRKK